VPSLWPLRDTRGMEKNWCQSGRFTSRVRTSELVDESLLWGLWRRRAYEGRGRMSLFPVFSTERRGDETAEMVPCLMGLLGYERKVCARHTACCIFCVHSHRRIGRRRLVRGGRREESDSASYT